MPMRTAWSRTYLHLRLGILLLVLLLVVSVAARIATDGHACIQHSVSAYYFTPVRPVFVGVLCAVGASLIVYKGNTAFEDAALGASGFLAFVVALIPPPLDRTCAVTNLPTEAELTSSVTNNVWSLLAVGAVTVLVGRRLARRDGLVDDRPVDAADLRATRAALVVAGIVLVIGVACLAFAREATVAHGHDVAAVAMFAGMIAVAVANAIGYARAESARHGALPTRADYANRYAGVAVSMAATLVGLPLLHLALPRWGSWFFWLELALIAEFAAFWALQTEELGVAPTRSEVRSPGLSLGSR